MKSFLKILMVVGPGLVAAGHWVPGVAGTACSIVGVAVTGLANLFHPTPAATAAFGASAK